MLCNMEPKWGGISKYMGLDKLKKRKKKKKGKP